MDLDDRISTLAELLLSKVSMKADQLTQMTVKRSQAQDIAQVASKQLVNQLKVVKRES